MLTNMNLPIPPLFGSLGSLYIMMYTKSCEDRVMGRFLLMHAYYMIRRLLQDFCQLSLAEGAAQS